MRQEARGQVKDREQTHQEKNPNPAKHVLIKPFPHRGLLWFVIPFFDLSLAMPVAGVD
jgi:hypothetical protein